MESWKSPMSGWLNCFQDETLQDGDKAGSLDQSWGGWVGADGWGREPFFLQGIWTELQQEAQGSGGGFIFQECIQLGNV